jgi:hypothetical protein
VQSSRPRSIRHVITALTVLAMPGGSVWSCTTESDAPERPSSDIARLSKYVVLPEKPLSALFLVSPMGKGGGLIGPSDRRLLALLRYDRDSLARLKASAQRLKPEVRSITLRERPDWFPEPLFSAVKRCAALWCVDGERYTGDAFLKGGFVTGSFIVPDGSEWLILRAGT